LAKPKEIGMRLTIDNLAKALDRMDVGYRNEGTYVTIPFNIQHVADGKPAHMSYISITLKPTDDGLWMWVVPVGIDKEDHAHIWMVEDESLLKAVGVLVDMTNSAYSHRIRMADARSLTKPPKLTTCMMPEMDVTVKHKKELQEGEIVALLKRTVESVGAAWSALDDKLDRMLSGDMADIESIMDAKDVDAVRKFVEGHPDELGKLRNLRTWKPAGRVQQSTATETSADPDVEVTVRVEG